MLENAVYIKKYFPQKDDAQFAVNEAEMWRYAGFRGMPAIEESVLWETWRQVRAELEDAFSYKVCYRRMPLAWNGEDCILPFKSTSRSLMRHLRGSSEIVIFAATVGMELDRKIARYQHSDQHKALLMQAYGTERVECLCDAFCEEIRQDVASEGLSCGKRFSPGYGDFALEAQKDFFRLLDCSRNIGIILNESLLMTPSKSVTAVFGIGGDKE